MTTPSPTDVALTQAAIEDACETSFRILFAIYDAQAQREVLEARRSRDWHFGNAASAHSPAAQIA